MAADGANRIVTGSPDNRAAARVHAAAGVLA